MAEARDFVSEALQDALDVPPGQRRVPPGEHLDRSGLAEADGAYLDSEAGSKTLSDAQVAYLRSTIDEEPTHRYGLDETGAGGA